MIQVIDAQVSVLAIQEATADAKLMFKIFLDIHICHCNILHFLILQ